MRQTLTDTNNVKWSIDFDEAHRIIRHYAMVRAINDNTHVVQTRESLLQKMRLFSAHGEIVQDWNIIKAAKANIEARTAYDWTATLTDGLDDAQLFLIDHKRKADALQKANTAKFNSAHEINRAAIDHAEVMIQGARAVQTASIISMGVIATVATGGATLYLATAAGSSLQGVATYQKTGSVGKALFDGALFMVPAGVGKFKMAAQAAGHSKTLVTSLAIGFETSADAAKHVIVDDAELGKAISTALINQAGSQAIGYAGDQAKRFLGQRLKGALTIFTDSHGGHSASNRTYPLMVEGVASVAKEITKVEASTPAEFSLGTTGIRARPEGGAQPVFMCTPYRPAPLSPAMPMMDEATRHVRQYVMSRM